MDTLDLYRKALNFNVIGRYDPKIKQLLFHTSHAVLYQYDIEQENWAKQEYQGVLAVYLRDLSNTSTNLLNDVSNESATLKSVTSSTAIKAMDTVKTDSSYVNEINNNNGSNGSTQQKVLQGQDFYNYGLIILNRCNPENFSLAITPNSVINKHKLFGKEEKQVLTNIQIEKNDELLIIKNLLGDVYGLWIYNEEDRETLYTLIKYLLENEPKDSFI
ncbi:related to mRNA-decapping enzyme subunit 1 [Saccharomycodes ludwigii]|uniref:Related to mRNA-decapping enzyme subunit 1 n=1 Tax=Saccharomycodes ludwigii TaxID=36035 RepID=A0A376B485_9ASCO|nr:hypothetical protein SCDLUD_000015 [Saccharomycodes ludwigii]KAH3902438.1 hypothetical protein SCDLUD_000015 [Saccharomycodes ludwigii]SSD59487.1 related to mRNA-decapping enzyme subunit 1 [Saccharomycodes ludwigii]